VAFVALIVKFTFPLPSPFGFRLLVPTTTAETTRLEGVVFVSVSPDEPLSELQEHSNTKMNIRKPLINIFVSSLK